MQLVRKLTWVELKLFAREPFALIFTFGFPLLVMVVVLEVFGTDPNPSIEVYRGLHPTDYYLASYIAVVIAAIGLVALPVHVAAYRERGILRRFRASSMPVWSVFGAKMIVGLLMATLGSVVLIVVARLAYDAALPTAPGAAVVAFLVATLSFLAIGLLLASLTPNARAAQALGMILFFPMWMLSGSGPPPDELSEGMRRVADAMPLTYAVRALQDPWREANSSATDLLVLTGLLVAAGLLSTRLLRAA